MTLDSLTTIGRILNIGLASVSLVWLFLTIRGWRDRSAGNRFLWMGVALFLVTTIYGTAEQLHNGVVTGSNWRVALTTVSMAYFLAGIVSKKRGRWTEDVKETEKDTRRRQELHDLMRAKRVKRDAR